MPTSEKHTLRRMEGVSNLRRAATLPHTANSNTSASQLRALLTRPASQELLPTPPPEYSQEPPIQMPQPRRLSLPPLFFVEQAPLSVTVRPLPIPPRGAPHMIVRPLPQPPSGTANATVQPLPSQPTIASDYTRLYTALQNHEEMVGADSAHDQLRSPPPYQVIPPALVSSAPRSLRPLPRPPQQSGPPAASVAPACSVSSMPRPLRPLPKPPQQSGPPVASNDPAEGGSRTVLGNVSGLDVQVELFPGRSATTRSKRKEEDEYQPCLYDE
ncbi:hypothetical protein BKA93DRAFT_751061 [Sparassis latifolia]